MRIVFLHSCLEPGRDGVGDYTRSLAQECVCQGHECSLISLNDSWVAQATTTKNTENGVPELRLPATQPWPHRIAQAQAWINDSSPDWVSLQFVPYGWHPKGFVHGLGRHLQPLTAGRRVHVMFHELWLGDATTSSVRHRFIGAVQKHLVRRLVRQLRPGVMHTSNETYVQLLRQAGLNAGRLPLFSGIPVTQENADAWLFPELQRSGLSITPFSRSSFLLAGFFGSLSADWPPEPLFSRLSEAAAGHGRQIALLSIGRIGAGKSVWNDLAQRYSSQFVFCHLGEQSEERVSQYLNSLDFGLAASPYTLIEKSSATAAMLDHGLPVIINRNDVLFSFSNNLCKHRDTLLHRLDEIDEDDKPLTDRLIRRPPQTRLPSVAQQMLRDLSDYTSSEKCL